MYLCNNPRYRYAIPPPPKGRGLLAILVELSREIPDREANKKITELSLRKGDIERRMKRIINEIN